MADKEYDKMPLGELLLAVSQGDQEAKKYHDMLLIRQVQQAEEFNSSHDIERFMKIFEPYYERLRETQKKAHDSIEKSIPIFKEMSRFAEDHADAIELITDTKTDSLRLFCNSLTADDFKTGLDMTLSEEEVKKFESDKQAYFLNLSIYDCITLIEYIKSKKRTAARAKKAGSPISELPKQLATITLSNFQFATSLLQQGNAYLQQFKGIDSLRFNDGKLYFPGNLQPLSEMELQNLKTKEGITEIDLPLLRVFYNAYLSEFQETKILKDVVSIFVPELAEFMGMKRNLTRQEIESKIIAKVQSFHNVTGVLKGWRNGKVSQSYYQVLNFEWYNEHTNTIAFSSPYMKLVIQTIYDEAIKRNKAGEPKLKRNGEPFRIPTHSYLIKSDIVKERNKAAVENVVIIVTLIEQAGDNTANIRAQTIIDRNPQLAERLESSPEAKTILKRVFQKTWELLRTKTRLQEVYKNIQLPDPKNPASIPTMKTLKTTVFSFPHEGKNEKPKMP